MRGDRPGAGDGGAREVRRRWAVVTAALVGISCVGVYGADPPAPDSRPPLPQVGTDAPNILIVMTDDQREGMGVMPKTRDWFRTGTRFTNAFATTPLCCPSRASILTGLYVHNHGVVRNEGDAWTNLDTDTTFPVYLQEAGYRTAMFGKYINRYPLDRPPPGFDRWALRATHQETAYYGGTWSIDGDLRVVYDYSTDFIADKGVRFIRRTEDPWMMMLNTSAPHLPFTPEPDYATARVGRWSGNPATEEVDRSDKPPYVRAAATRPAYHRRVRRDQLRTLMSVDDLVARVRRALIRTHEARDTLVLFMTDNAYTWGEHGLSDKVVPYLTSVRIPLYLRWPGHVGSGETDDRLAANIDVAPTIMDAAGLEPPTEMDGRSLLDPWTREYLLTENFNARRHVPEWAALIAPDRHYIEVYDETGLATFHEEYDLETDPWELENLLWNGVATSPSPDLAPRLAAALRCRAESCP